MPIGYQKFGDIEITSEEFKRKYDDLIKEAILKADSTLNVIRADEMTEMGSVMNQIITLIMYSNFVIADITYPNPNVFYELGLRHAIGNGTILIKEKIESIPPFDVGHLRYIEYENTPTGLKELSMKFEEVFKSYEENPGRFDNSFLEIAFTSKFEYPKFTEPVIENEEQNNITRQALFEVLEHEKLSDLMKIFSDTTISQLERNQKAMNLLLMDPKLAPIVMRYMKDYILAGQNSIKAKN